MIDKLGKRGRALAGAVAVGVAAIIPLIGVGAARAAAPVEKIVFVSDRDGGSDIYLMDPAGTEPATRLTTDGAEKRGPQISPDGTRIAFTSAGAIWTMNIDGSIPQQITTGTPEDERPTWSPDGTKLAFSRKYTSKNVADWDIVIRSATPGGSETRVSRPSNDHDPDWSSGGIVFSAAAGQGDTNLWTMDATGGSLTQRTFYKDPATEPAWSRDGTKIAFALWHKGSTGEAIMTLDVGSGATRQITPGNQDVFPAWSPDGSKVVFRHYDVKSSKLYVVPATGGSSPALVANQVGNSFAPFWGTVATPTGSPTPTCVTPTVCV